MITLIATLILLGLVFYFIEMIPMAAPFPQIIRVVAMLVAVILVLNFLGVHVFPLNIR